MYRSREEAQGTERDKVGHLLVAPLQGRKSGEQMFREHYIKVKHVAVYPHTSNMQIHSDL